MRLYDRLSNVEILWYFATPGDNRDVASINANWSYEIQQMAMTARGLRVSSCCIALALMAWTSLMCFLSLLVVSARDPWPAIAAGVVPVVLVPLALTAWKLPRFALYGSATILVLSDVFCGWGARVNWSDVLGCAIQFTKWGHVSLLFLVLNLVLAHHGSIHSPSQETL